MSAPTYEFEAECAATLVETWQVVIPDGDRLDPDELAERCNEMLPKADFISEEAEDEQDRVLLPDTIERVG